MAESGKPFSLKVVVSAIDKLTEPVERMNAKMKALNAPFREVNTAIKRLGEASGVERLGEKFHVVGERAAEVGRNLGELFAKAAAIGGISVGAGLEEIVRGTAEAGEQAELSAQKAGVSVKAWQEYAYVAKLANVENEALTKGFKGLDNSIVEARRKGGEQREIFRAFHVSLGELRKDSPDKIFAKLADGFSKMGDEGSAGAIKAAVATKLFGKSGIDLIPVLNKGSKSLEEIMAKTRELGIIMSDHDVKAAAEFADKGKTLQAALLGVRNAIGSGLIPVLEPLVDESTKWLVANRALIATKITEFVSKLKAELPGLRDKVVQAWDASKGFRDALGGLIDKVGPINALLVGFGAITFGPLIGSMASLGIALLGLVGPLATFGTAFWASGLGEIVAVVAALAALPVALHAIDKIAPNVNVRAGQRPKPGQGDDFWNKFGHWEAPAGFKGRGGAVTPLGAQAEPGAFRSLGDRAGDARAAVNALKATPPPPAGEPSAGTRDRLDVNIEVKGPRGTKVTSDASRGVNVRTGRVMQGAH